MVLPARNQLKFLPAVARIQLEKEGFMEGDEVGELSESLNNLYEAFESLRPEDEEEDPEEAKNSDSDDAY